ncbi:MAG: T9SS type A sorting domain-containing protein [Flavobacteriales bacterium]|nr:T9SS type A sorting domain-containing protein [Flavobacteriales bacterium]
MKRILLSVFVLIAFLQTSNAQVNPTNRQIVLQGFWWDYWNSNYPNGWANYLAELAPRLKDLGVDAVWIPPTIKNAGTNSVGYSPFDHYDLGDKWQKNSLKTRVGDKDELLRMVAVMKANGIDVIQDIVLNHVTNAGSATGAGGADPAAMDDGSTAKFKNFRYVAYGSPATNESSTNYLTREGRFPKNWQNFYPNNNNVCCTNAINSPYWGPDVSYESNAFGLSSNATFNPVQSSDYMRTNMRNWMIWYKKQVGWDGIRIDAVKHFPSYVMEDILWNLQNNAGWASGGNEFFSVGEWVGGASDLDSWVGAVQDRSGTFDFAIRGAIQNMVNGNGNFDLATIPSAQQSNRNRTVPFVNNHDTFRPILTSSGNYNGWNSGSQLGTQIEPNDGRNSAAHAIALSVDGAPQIFFEDLFNIGYNGNRFNHRPNVDTTLPVRSDIENLIWCHQNLRFKEGAYFVRWQAADALVIERGGKALIGITDNWTTWQDLNGVQTSWPDGTVLVDYSGANGTATRTVYGGGKVNISIPPCNGTAAQGRRGYCVWAPEGIVENYERPAKTVTQEWEMEDDLGDSNVKSLEQGGRLPNNSLDCRTVGRIFAKSGSQISLELYPSAPTNSITLILVDKECNQIDSISGTGNLVFNKTATYDGWHTIRIRNTTATQNGQKCWVKATYTAPAVIQTNVVKNKCACAAPSTVGLEELIEENGISVYPNPSKESITVEFTGNYSIDPEWAVLDLSGKKVLSGNDANFLFHIDISQLMNGYYVFTSNVNGVEVRKKFVKMAE